MNKLYYLIILFFSCGISCAQNSKQNTENFLSEKEFDTALRNEIGLIKEHFEITEPFIGTMGSIDWDMFTNGDCWWAKLHEKNEPKNLLFSVTMEFNYIDDSKPFELPIKNPENFKPGSIKPLLIQKDSILKRVHGANFLIEKIKTHPESKLEIHYTVNKSFSKSAQESFLTDAPDEIKKKYKRDLENTILLTLEDKENWSRWLIFPNEDIMLWHYQGKSPINEYSVAQLKIPGGLFNNSCKVFNANGQLMK